MSKQLRELQSRKAILVKDARALTDIAASEQRDMNDEEVAAFEALKTKFSQQTSNLIGLSGARLDVTLANSVKRQYGLLLSRFDRHKMHIGTRHRLTNRLQHRQHHFYWFSHTA